MVEIVTYCDGTLPPHEVVVVFADPVNWDAVNKALAAKRCEAHPEWVGWDCE